MGRLPESNEEVRQRWTNVGCNTQVMEAMLGISLYSYLYLKLAKRYVFLIISYVFSLTKSENKRVLSGKGGWGEEVAQTVYSHVSKRKKDKLKERKKEKRNWKQKKKLKENFKRIWNINWSRFNTDIKFSLSKRYFSSKKRKIRMILKSKQ
jgi:hypothetical protein